MKLYSKGQVARRIFFGSAVAFVLTAVVFYNLGKNSVSKNQSAAGQNVAENVVLDEPEPLISDSDDIVFPVAANSAAYSQDENENIAVYKNCNEAVVNINTKVIEYSWMWDAYQTDGGSGSGSIIDQRGYILTNVHVISGADANVPADAKQCITTINPVETFKKDGFDYTKCDFQIETGRQHQIRAQSAFHGHPLAGDTAYGAHTSSFKFDLCDKCLVFPANNLGIPDHITIDFR